MGHLRSGSAGGDRFSGEDALTANIDGTAADGSCRNPAHWVERSSPGDTTTMPTTLPCVPRRSQGSDHPCRRSPDTIRRAG